MDIVSSLVARPRGRRRGLRGYAVGARPRASGAARRRRSPGAESPQPVAGAVTASRRRPQYSAGRWPRPPGPSPSTRAEPSSSARQGAARQESTSNGYPTLVLVDTPRRGRRQSGTTSGCAMRPNGARAGSAKGSWPSTRRRRGSSSTSRSARSSVYRRATLKGTFPVAVGTARLATPTGYFFITRSCGRRRPGGPYGVLALGISAFQPKLRQAGPRAGRSPSTGPTRTALIGKADQPRVRAHAQQRTCSR